MRLSRIVVFFRRRGVAVKVTGGPGRDLAERAARRRIDAKLYAENLLPRRNTLLQNVLGLNSYLLCAIKELGEEADVGNVF